MRPWTNWNMHPYPADYWRSVHRHRRGSRLFWFIIGAGTAALWMKHHQVHEWQSRNCWRDRIPQDAYPAPGVAHIQTSASSNLAEDAQKRCGEKRWGMSWGSKEGFKSWSAPPARETQATSAPPTHLPPVPMPSDRWEEDRARVQGLGKQATDTISDLSEATLESVLQTVQALKVKLAEHRTQREQQIQKMEAIKDEQYKMFEEWRKQRKEKQQEQKSGAQQPPKPRYPVDFTSA